jgi:hypothetical protein
VCGSGYASSSVCKLISCSFCQELIKEAKGNEIDDPYFDDLQRGGLCLATEYVVNIFFTCMHYCNL